MSKEKIILKREDFWLWSVSRSLSFKTYDLSKTKRREKLSLFSAVTLSHFHFHRANNETTTTSPPKGTFPFFRCARRLSHAEKRKEKDRITLEKFKNVRLLLVGENPRQQTCSSSIQRGRRASVASLDRYRNDRERCTEDKDVYETHHVQQVHPHGHVSVASVVVKTGAS